MTLIQNIFNIIFDFYKFLIVPDLENPFTFVLGVLFLGGIILYFVWYLLESVKT